MPLLASFFTTGASNNVPGSRSQLWNRCGKSMVKTWPVTDVTLKSQERPSCLRTNSCTSKVPLRVTCVPSDMKFAMDTASEGFSATHTTRGRPLRFSIAVPCVLCGGGATARRDPRAPRRALCELVGAQMNIVALSVENAPRAKRRQKQSAYRFDCRSRAPSDHAASCRRAVSPSPSRRFTRRDSELLHRVVSSRRGHAEVSLKRLAPRVCETGTARARAN